MDRIQAKFVSKSFTLFKTNLVNCLLLCILLLCLQFSIQHDISSTSSMPDKNEITVLSQKNTESKQFLQQSYTSITEFVAANSGEFHQLALTHGFPGTGTDADPYIITGFNFTGTNRYTLNLTNVNLAIQIEKNIFASSGIFLNITTSHSIEILNNTINVEVENTITSDEIQSGIFATASAGFLEIRNNIIQITYKGTQTTQHGIYLDVTNELFKLRYNQITGSTSSLHYNYDNYLFYLSGIGYEGIFITINKLSNIPLKFGLTEITSTNDRELTNTANSAIFTSFAEVIYNIKHEQERLVGLNSSNVQADYIAYFDGFEVQKGTISEGLTIGDDLTDALTLGAYNITTLITNSNNQVFKVELKLTITDVDPPKVSQPGDIRYLYGSEEEYSISWSILDIGPTGSYYILENSLLYPNKENGGSFGQWTPNSIITINVSGLEVGLYNYTIVIFDREGNSGINAVFVIVYELIAPTVTTPNDISYELGAEGNEIIWTPADNSLPGIYNLYQNKQLTQASVTWTNNTDITIDVVGLGAGEHNFSIEIFDFSNNSRVDMVKVSVHDTIAPTITITSQITYTVGETGNFIRWNIFDISNSGTYTVYKNGSTFKIGEWMNSVPVSINIDDLQVGNYNFTISVTDQNDNSKSNSVNVSVIAQHLSTSSSTDFTANPGTNNFGIYILLTAIVLLLVIGLISGIRFYKGKK